MTTELARFVMDQLVGDRVRPMFGGWGIYRNGEMVAIVYDERTYSRPEPGRIGRGSSPQA